MKLTAVLPVVPLEVFAGEGFQFDFILKESARDAKVESRSLVIKGFAAWVAAGAPPKLPPDCCGVNIDPKKSTVTNRKHKRKIG